MASSPLHEAGKTTKSGDTLKPGRREELGFASDTLSSAPNACPLISTFSRPHSEVASTTHIPALKGIPKKRFAVFWFTQAGRPPTNTAFKNAAKWGTSPGKGNPSPAGRNIPRTETSPPKNKIPLSGRILSQERPSLLGQIERLTLSRKSTVFPVLGKLPFRR